jgi:hypothetical protein
MSLPWKFTDFVKLHLYDKNGIIRNWNLDNMLKNSFVDINDALYMLDFLPESIKNRRHIDETIDMRMICKNKTIGIQDIINHFSILKLCGFVYISQNPSLRLEDIPKHDIKWWRKLLSKNPNITIKFIVDHPDNSNHVYISGHWRWSDISANPGIKIKDIYDYPDLPWDWYYVSMNPNLTFEDILKLKDGFKTSKGILTFGYISTLLYWTWISLRIPLTIQQLKNSRDLPWDYSYLSRNMSFTLSDMLLNFDIPWNFKKISRIGSTLDDVRNYPILPWVWANLCSNIPISMKDAQSQDIKNKIEWEHMAENPAIKFKDIHEHPDIGWNWFDISHKCYDEDISIVYLHFVGVVMALIGFVPEQTSGFMPERSMRCYLPPYIILWITDWMKYYHFYKIPETKKLGIINAIIGRKN